MHKKLALIPLFFITCSFCSQSLKPRDNITKQISNISNAIQKSLFDRSIKNQNQENEQIVYTFKNLTNQQIDDAFSNVYKDIISFYQSINTNTINLKTHTEFLKAYYQQHPYVFSSVCLICSLSIAHSVYAVIDKARKKKS